jgi:HEAT repeat protein
MWSLPVRKRLLLIPVAILLAGLIAGMLASRPRPSEVVHQGKSIQAWSSDASAGDATTRQRAEAALKSLGSIAVPGLVDLLDRRDSFFRKWIWNSAGRWPFRLRQSVLSRIRAPLAQEVRLASVHALGFLGPQAAEARPALARALRDEDRAVAHGAALALAQTGTNAIPLLIQALSDRRPEVRVEAAFGLGQMGADAEAAVPALVKCLSDPSESVHLASAHSLSNMGGASISKLIEVVKNERGRARRGAAKAIGWAYPSRRLSVPPLLEMVRDEDPASRKQAIETLAALNATSEPVIAALTEALKDPVMQVRLAATDALRSMKVSPPSVTAQPAPMPK